MPGPSSTNHPARIGTGYESPNGPKWNLEVGETWCNEEITAWVKYEGVVIASKKTLRCRFARGHGGDHGCPSLDQYREDGVLMSVDKPPVPQAPSPDKHRARSAAARAVFGSETNGDDDVQD